MASRYWWLPPMVLLQVADILLTQRAGLAYETNPQLLWLWETWSVWAVVAGKAGLVLALALLGRLAYKWRLHPSDLAVYQASMLLGVVHMAVVCARNVRVCIIVS